MSSESDNDLKLISDKSTERTKQRTEIAKKQKQLMDELVDMRVKMQGILLLVNKLPQGKLRNEFIERNEDIKKKTNSIETMFAGALNSIIKSDMEIAERIPDLYSNKATFERVKEIASSLNPRDGNHYYACLNVMTNRKRAWEESTADHWTKRAQVQSGKTLRLTALNKSIFEQTDSVLEDDIRWHKRCTVIRGDYQIVGEEDRVEEDGQRRNASVYDDQEFYNSLLNQYAALAMNNAATLIQQRNSKKKEIQRKASKGRRLIYTVHPKLQNFCTPEKYPQPNIDVDQLFSSLFGKKSK